MLFIVVLVNEGVYLGYMTSIEEMAEKSERSSRYCGMVLIFQGYSR